MQFLIKNGPELPSHITTTLCTLICRITSLSWMIDTRERNILDLMLQYTKSRDNCIIALTVLEELVSQMNPKSSPCPLPYPQRRVHSSRTRQRFSSVRVTCSTLRPSQ